MYEIVVRFGDVFVYVFDRQHNETRVAVKFSISAYGSEEKAREAAMHFINSHERGQASGKVRPIDESDDR